MDTHYGKLFRCRYYPAPSSKRVIFFFCAMLTRLWLYTPLFRTMNRLGYTVYAYDVEERRIFKTHSASQFSDFVELIRHDVESQIRDEKKHGSKFFAAFGVSMGTIYALDCAKYITDIQKLVINLTYGSIATNVWTYRFHRPTRARFERAGVLTETMLREELGASETVHNLAALRGKRVLIYSSKSDRVLADTLEFKNAAKAAGLDAEYYDSSLGHYAAGAVNLLRSTRWTRFLQGD